MTDDKCILFDPVAVAMATVQEYLLLDEASLQTVSADGERTSYLPIDGNVINRLILIEDYNSIVGWLQGKTDLRVSCCAFSVAFNLQSNPSMITVICGCQSSLYMFDYFSVLYNNYVFSTRLNVLKMNIQSKTGNAWNKIEDCKIEFVSILEVRTF